jgi:hypothetical protein
VSLQAEFDQHLWSADQGGYFNTANDASQDLLVRERSYQDNATPAANGVAIANLVRLALLSEDLTYLDRAEQALRAFGTIMEKAPNACPSLFSGLDWFYHHTLIRTSRDRASSLSRQYYPNAVYQLETMPDGAVGLVCQGLSCQEPAQSDDQLTSQIQHSQVRAA